MAVRWRSIVLITVLSALLGLVLAAPALAAGGTVSGVVSDSQTVAPIPGIAVELWDTAGGLSPVAVTAAGVSGAYSFSGVAPGTYEVWAGSGSYYWGSAPAEFTVTADEACTRDIALDPIPDIRGTVYDATANPVAGATVTVWAYDPISATYYECTWANSDASGAYAFPDIGDGDYYVTFEAPGYVSCTYPSAAYRDFSSVSPVTVGAVDRVGVDAHMESTGVPPAIVGRLTRADGSSTAGLAIRVYRSIASGWVECASAKADSTGNYSFSGLDDGTYRVGVAAYSTDAAGRIYDETYWTAATSVTDASNVRVSSGTAVNGVDIEVRPMPLAYVGRVFDATTKLAIPNATVELLLVDERGFSTVMSATTDSIGRFALYGRRGLTYCVKASAADHAAMGTSPMLISSGAESGNLYLPASDTTPPTLRCSVYNNRSSWVTLNTFSSDAAGSPLVMYSMNGGPAKRSVPPVSFTVPGDYAVKVIATDFNGNTTTQTLLIWVRAGGLADRVGGANRYDVAVNMASLVRGNLAYSDVIVACGENRAMADPLGAAALASAYDCPVLLTPTAKASPSTISAIRTMAAANGGRVNIHVVGGTASIPKTVFNALATAKGAGSIERISGSDRYDLAYRIAARTKTVLESRGRSVAGVIVVNIENPASFNDALAVSPISARGNMPLIGVRGASIPGPAASALAMFAGKPRYALNSAYLSTGVRDAAGSGSIVTSSADREVAAVDIAKWGVSSGFLSYKTVGLVNKLSDALPAGTAMGQFGGPLLYTSPATLSPTTRTLLMGVHEGVSRGIVFGGGASVSEEVVAQFASSYAF